jgi:nitrogen-specific signal transduction histidine kinase/CheY-like chemotaxis protein
VGRDVTLERQRQAELERAEEALRQSQKMEAVGQLTGGIAHDFNNLLTGILGGLDIVKRRIADGRFHDVDRFLDAATVSANRAAALIHRLLAFSRRQSLDSRPIDVDRLVGSIEDLLLRTLGEKIRLRLSLDAGDWRALTDANQLESAILNLVINARDAMPDGGDLTIGTSCRTIAAAETGSLEAGDYIEITVRDTGTGIDPELVDRVFDPFFTTKPIGQGTGLGLSMIYGFMRQSRGEVILESRPGEGTCVRLLMPRSAESDGAGPGEAPATETPIAVPGETVLVVEDDDGVRQLVLEVLHELGYVAIEAASAEPAVPILRSTTRIDLLVTDVGLPGMDGRALADVARETRPDLRVLFMTGYAEKAALRGGFLASGMDMIAKPFTLDALAGKLREMISGA